MSSRSLSFLVTRFQDQPNYLEQTRQDFTSKQALPVTYTWNTGDKVSLIFRMVTGLYRLLHILAGKIALLPAAMPTRIGISRDDINDSRQRVCLEGDWKYKRITVEVDGYKVDAMIVGQTATLDNGRWVLYSNGNAEFYEGKLYDFRFKQILTEIDGNAIVFNYPGVGASSGFPSRQAMAKAYRAMLSFLEDKEKGIGAQEIVGYGHSIGAGVQGDALKTHVLKKDVKYVFVRSRTFSDLTTIVSSITCRPLGWVVKLLGWNMDSKVSSEVPEIIMQTAAVEKCEELRDSSQIIGDGIISANASLAKTLLDDPAYLKTNKLFVGMKEGHNGGLYQETISFLADKINEFLARPEEVYSRHPLVESAENFVRDGIAKPRNLLQ